MTKPEFGLVCLTTTNAVRFRTITRTNYLKLNETARHAKLKDLYHDNTNRLLGALEFCRQHDIHLYRMTSQLYPMSDLEDGIGLQVLAELAPTLPEIARRANEYRIRIVVHPDQFVVLSSDSPNVVENSTAILTQHARNLDLMQLPQTPWTTILIHGGKGNRALQLTERIEQLPPNIRNRLALENDEHIYSAEEILQICRATRVPFVFDAHHHIIKENLDSYEHPSLHHYVTQAKTTWPNPDWQIVHLSNGKESLHDRRHSDLIDTFPSAFQNVPWIEVEAKGKENAIIDLQRRITHPNA